MSQTIHLAPGETLTVIADQPTGPSCAATITGSSVRIDAKGLTPGEQYGMWWGVYKAGTSTPYYKAGASLQTAWDGTTYWVYPLRAGHTEVYVYPAPLAMTWADAEARAVAECEYDA